MKRTLYAICLLGLVPLLMGSSYTIPNSFTGGTTAVATQVNANFTAAKTAIDDNDLRIDALLASDTCTTPPCALTAGTTLNGATILTSGGAYSTIEDEGIARTQRATLNFVGAGVSCVDDTTRTTCTIAGGGSANSFETQNVPAGTDPVADGASDTLNWTTTSGAVTLTGDSSTDTINISLEATLEDIMDGTIAENLVNTANPWAVNEGGTGAATFTSNAVLLGNTTSAIQASVVTIASGAVDGVTTLDADGAVTAPSFTADDPGDGTRGVSLLTNTSAIGEGASGQCKLGFVGTTLNKHCNGGALTSLEGGSGNVTKVGTPVDSQVGVWTGDGTIEGDTAFTFDTSTDTLAGPLVFTFGTGTGTLNALDAIDATTETTLETAIDIAGDVTGTGLATVSVVAVQDGAAPTVASAGAVGIDTTDAGVGGDQLLFYDGTAARALNDVKSHCVTIESLAAADDDKPIWLNSYLTDATLISASCVCVGTCTTEADVALELVETGAGTVNAVTGTIDCEDQTTGDTNTALSGNTNVDLYDIVRMDVSNTPSPETDDYVLCFNYRPVVQ